jgi:PiT family inorganic phosphate transporter
MDLISLAGLTIVLTLGFEFVNGFHDSANSIATIVATKVLTPVKAVTMAAVFNFVGIYWTSEVAKTIGKGIIDIDLVQTHGPILVLCAVSGAIVWDLITWWFGIPTSSSHALVGGLIGAGGAVAGLSAVVWTGTLKTAVFIIISPLAGLLMAFALTVFVMHVAKRFSRAVVNKWFRKSQIVSAAVYSLSHGSNDAQKGAGIITMVLLFGTTDTFIVPLWVMVACGASLALGTFFGGWRIVKTMASRITKLEPYQGFCAETGASIMLLATARLGIPVSTTHTISGGIMGVGATRRLSAVRWGVGRKIMVAWILTIPAAATISGAMFWILRYMGCC